MDKKIEIILEKLSKSNFRRKFKLDKKNKEYIKKIGYEKIEEHARDFINKRLKDAIILNDGKQTPMHGHPVFVAQHACACCCRGCLKKWHNIEPGKELNDNEIEYIIKLIMTWIKRQ